MPLYFGRVCNNGFISPPLLLRTPPRRPRPRGRRRRRVRRVLRAAALLRAAVGRAILSAIEGRFGNHHRTDRTEGSDLFINPLMGLYWCFALEQVARRVLYLEGVADIEGFVEFQSYIGGFRRSLGSPLRAWKDLPM